MKNQKEIWKTVVIDGVEHPRYQVSNLGRVKCLDWNRTGKPRLCGLSDNGQGYFTVNIDGIKKRVHRLVAEAFIPNPNCLPEVDHIDTDRQNNVVDVDGSIVTNLRWSTRSENDNNPITRKHKSEFSCWKGKYGKEHNRSKEIVQLSLDGVFIKKWYSSMDVYRELNVTQGSVIKCCQCKRKSAGGYRWMYYSDWLKIRKPKRSLADIQPLF